MGKQTVAGWRALAEQDKGWMAWVDPPEGIDSRGVRQAASEIAKLLLDDEEDSAIKRDLLASLLADLEGDLRCCEHQLRQGTNALFGGNFRVNHGVNALQKQARDALQSLGWLSTMWDHLMWRDIEQWTHAVLIAVRRYLAREENVFVDAAWDELGAGD